MRSRHCHSRGSQAIRAIALAFALIAARSCGCGLLGLALASTGQGTGARAVVRVALTREKGQNGKLRKLLREKLQGLEDGMLDVVELPCIEHGPGPDHAALEGHISALAAGARPFDTVILTSPEAARVFLGAWSKTAGDLALPVAVVTVGRGTSKVVEEIGQNVVFEPSVANAETLAAELPESFGRVLYPASASAQATLQEGLAARGFPVERINTYTTQAVQHFDEQDRQLMETTAVATFGSPSAVKAWAQLCSRKPIAACIGGTSRKAAESAGFQHICAPEKPGLAGWANVTATAAMQLLSEQTASPVGC